MKNVTYLVSLLQVLQLLKQANSSSVNFYVRQSVKMYWPMNQISKILTTLQLQRLVLFQQFELHKLK